MFSVVSVDIADDDDVEMLFYFCSYSYALMVIAHVWERHSLK